MAWPPTTHQDVEDDLTNGHGWAMSLSERLQVGERLTSTPLVTSTNRWLTGGAMSINATTTAPTPGAIRLVPLYFAAATSVNAIACQVTTIGTSGHVARMGVYNSSPTTRLPTTALVDSGTVAVGATTGEKSVTISAVLHGLYWLAIVCQSGTFRAHPATGQVAIAGNQSVNVAADWMMETAASYPATNALPDLTSITLTPGTSPTPVVGLRVG